MENSAKIRSSATFVARTAMFIAMLVAVQFITRALGQIVTGSCVNFVLAVCALTCGVWSASIVAVISPFCAFLLGIGTPIIRLVPFIGLGNFVYVFLICLLEGRIKLGRASRAAVILIAAVAKFATLFVSITKIILPLMALPEAKTAVLSASFTWPQLITALIGGALAVIVYGRFPRSGVKDGE